MKYFSRKNLPMSEEMLKFWNKNGFLVIDDFNTSEECDELINRSSELIDNNNFDSQNSIFDTVNQSHNDDNYFLNSGDKIRFFLKKKLALMKRI